MTRLGRPTHLLARGARRAVLLLSAAAAAVASPLEAQVPTTSDTPRRLVARFDFEENAEFSIGVPIGFYRVLSTRSAAAPDGRTVAPGLPEFGDYRISRDGGVDGGFAIECLVDGASIVLATEPDRIPIDPDARLEVRASVRTDGLVHSGVRVSARFRDTEGSALPGVWSTSVIRSEGAWRRLVVEPPEAPAEARSLELWLEVVQPGDNRAAEGERFDVTLSDVRGRAYFDDLEVWQLPTTRFRADGSGIVEPGDTTRLTVSCTDPESEAVRAQVDVHDASGATVFTHGFDLARERTVTVEVPPLPSGWYEAEARFSGLDDGLPVARRLARFAVLPDDPFEPDEPPRFGASLDRLDGEIDAAVELARSAFVVLPVWTDGTDTRDPEHELDRLRPIVAKLFDRRVEAMFRLAEVPSALARAHRIDTEDTLALWGLPSEAWRPSLEPWLLAFGQQVDQWFLAADPIDPARDELAERVAALADAMRAAIAGPSIGVPWSPEEPLPAQGEASLRRGRHVLEVVADGTWGAAGASAYEGLPTGGFGMARIVPLPAGLVDDRSRAIDLALRAIDAWRAGFHGIAVEVDSESPEGTQPIPGPPLELAAWRQISTRLCGRDFVAEIPVSEDGGDTSGVQAILADGPRGAALILWNESSGEPVELALELGAGEVVATDLWGRSRRVPPGRDGHTLLVGREPLFVEGVETGMCLLRRSLRIEPGFVESRRAPQDAELVLANPWNTPFSGTLSIASSGGIEVSPRSHAFELPSGGEIRLPVAVSVPRNLAAGPVEVLVDIEGTALEPFRARISTPLETGHRGVSVSHRWRLARSIERGGVDLVLTLAITNLSSESLDLESFAVADGYTQSRKPVTSLAPGATASRTFHFADGVRRLSGRDIRAGVHDADGDARLLQRIAIPPLLPPSAVLAGAEGEAANP